MFFGVLYQNLKTHMDTEVQNTCIGLIGEHEGYNIITNRYPKYIRIASNPRNTVNS